VQSRSANTTPGVLELWFSDVRAWYPHVGRVHRWLGALTNPSLRACLMFRCCQNASGATYWLIRSLLISWFSCDVARGAHIGPALRLPHPVGIVIGRGTEIGANVTIYQHVTMGALRDGYPTVDDGATIMPGAIVVGAVRLGRGSTVGALAYVDRSVDDASLYVGKSRS
jgi:serine O-acetyltransferase